MNRTKSREEAFKVLYSFQISADNDINSQIDLFITEENITDTEAIEYIKNLVNGVNNNSQEIENQITENIKKEWTIGRISKIDLALIKLGIYEIIYSKLPYKVVINEVVELAKIYGDDNSKSFVNGILASVVKKNNLIADEDKKEE